MAYQSSRRNRILRVVIVALAIAFLFVGPVSAHGGEGDHLQGSVSVWMIVLLYMQFVSMPVVGLWLVKEAASAWLSLVDRNGVEVQ